MNREEKEKHWSYQEIVKRHPQLEGVIDSDSWDYIGKSNKTTGTAFEKRWRENTRRNVERKTWKRHGSLRKDCIGLGKNKAILGVGAGASFNKNKKVFEKIAYWDGRKPWEERDFIIVASNHQFKPLIKMGIIPDFVILVDASDDIIPQLTEDIPSRTECGTILISTIAASPTMIKRWTRQGRDIRFFVPASESVVDEFHKVTGEDPALHETLIGGNVLNCLFLIGLTAFRSSTFMALGNDLSYSIDKSIEKRRAMYYADGDYKTTQMQKGRDEAKNSYRWMGVSSLERPIIYMGPSGYKYTLGPVGTTHNLWVYKTWMESWLLANMGRDDLKYHYYNCSEGGILGVMCKVSGEKATEKDWYLLDEVCPQYHTMMLEDATNQFMIAKEAMQWTEGVTGLGVQSVIDLVRQRTVGIAKSTNPSELIIGT